LNLNGGISFAEYMKNAAALVESALREVFPADWQIPPTLREAMDYSLLGGGKRMRAILVLASAEACGGEREKALPAACAIELVHAYSLIHDDLPAMDNDDLRRGKPTNHKVYGEAMAILAGDGLLTHAFHCVAQCHRRFGVPAEVALAIVEELAAFSGARGMVGGQAADMEGEQGVTELAELDVIHARKTGDLIVFAARAGGRIAGATERQLEALAQFGRNIGLAFQIVDDVLDVTGDEAKLGKRVRSDEKKRKVTYPYFLGVEASLARARQLTEEAKRAIREANVPHPSRLLELADFLLERDR
jgi:geranylgeranyl diphosphate synthase type II